MPATGAWFWPCSEACTPAVDADTTGPGSGAGFGAAGFGAGFGAGVGAGVGGGGALVVEVCLGEVDVRFVVGIVEIETAPRAEGLVDDACVVNALTVVVLFTG